MKNQTKPTKPKISVIIPCYNNAIFMKECLDSVINQTFRDIEIIAINDGSTDETAEIVQDYANRDNRIVFINRENKGVSYSLNEGIKISKGEYLAFLDSDDYYDLDYLKNTYEAAKKYDLDLVSVDYIEFTGNKKDKSLKTNVRYCSKSKSCYNTVFDGNEKFALEQFIHRWRTLFRRKLVIENEIFHNEKLIGGEDVSFFFESVCLAKRIMFLDFAGVFHRKDNDNSITKSPEKLSKHFFGAQLFTKDQLIKRGFWESKKEIFLRLCVGNFRFALKNIPFDYHMQFVLDYSNHLKTLTENIEFNTNIISQNEMKKLLSIIHTPIDYYESWRLDKYKVSVIMSVYNAEEFLQNTLNSLIAQTLKEIEIILVDDGSTDKTLTIMNEYAKIDSRVTILQQKNQGAGAGRNLGMQNAHGTYLLFLDADDYFYPTMLQETFQKAQKTNAEIVWFLCEEYDAKRNVAYKLTKNFANNGLNFPDKEVFQFGEIKNNPFTQTNGWAWDKLIERKFVLRNNLRFNPTPVMNDMNFTYSAMAKASKITTINKVLLRRIVGHGCNISRSKHDEFPHIFFENYLRLLKDIKSISIVLASFLTLKLIEVAYWHFNTAITLDSSAEIAFDTLTGGFLDEFGFSELSEDDCSETSKEKYLFLKRVSEYKPGQFAEFKDSLINYPITITMKNNQNKRELLFCPGRKTNAKILFKQKPDVGEGTAAPFFSLKLEELEHKSVIAKIEFVYLDDNKPAIYDTLYFGAYVRIVDEQPILEIYQAQWEYGRKIFIENLYFTVNGVSITFYCKYTKQFTGFEYRLLSLTSRDGTGDSNDIILSLISKGGLVVKMSELPKNAKAITESARNDAIQEIGKSCGTDGNRVIFKINQPNNSNRLGVLLFRISLPNADNQYCTAKIEFEHLNKNEPNCYATLHLGIINEEGAKGIGINQLDWNKKTPLNELIYFVREEGALACYGKFTGKATGYHFRVKNMTSLDLQHTFNFEAQDNMVMEMLTDIPSTAILANALPSTEVGELVACIAELLDEIDLLKEHNNELADRLLKIEAALNTSSTPKRQTSSRSTAAKPKTKKATGSKSTSNSRTPTRRKQL